MSDTDDTKGTQNTKDAKDTSDTNGGDASPDPSRAQELEIWDRVLKRWNEHTARQIRNVGIAVSVVIALAGFLGIRSIDRMVEETMGNEVKEATAIAVKTVEQDTKRLSDQLGDNLATMIVKLAAFEQQSKEASNLIAKMQKNSKEFDRLDAELNDRMAKMAAVKARFDGLEQELNIRIAKAEAVTAGVAGLDRELRTKLDGFRATLARGERELKESLNIVRGVKKDVDRANRIATSIALAAAPAQKIEIIEKLAPLAPEEVSALRVSQVPDKLEKYTSAGRPYYLLNYTITVDKQATARNPDELLDSIEAVTYQFEKRWFKRSEIERTNRADNFRLGMRVWGSTEVGVRARLTGRARPVCWSGPMSLDKPVMLKPSACPPP